MQITLPPRTNISEFDTWMEQLVSLLRMDNNELRLGDDITGNYLAVESDGTIEFNGDGTVWDDLRVSLATAKAPAANAPGFEQVVDDGAASIGVFSYHFADGQYLFLTTQMPHNWKVGSIIFPHIHFMTTSDVDPADNFKIGYEYTWTDKNEDIAATTSGESRDLSTGVDSSGQHQLLYIPTTGLSGAGKTIESIFLIRLYRAAAAADNYADDVIITDFDIHYEIDTIGSRGMGTK